MSTATKARGNRSKAKPVNGTSIARVFDQPPHYDAEAEVSLLGSVLLLPSVLVDVVRIVRIDDFHDEVHRQIYQALLAISTSGRAIDPVILVNELKSAGIYEAIGGAAYLGKILNAVPHAAHAIHYAEIVRDKAYLRRAFDAGTELLRQVAEPSATVQAVRALTELKLSTLVTGDRLFSRPPTLRELITRCPELKPPVIRGLQRRGEIMNIIAPPKVGKSWLVTMLGIRGVTGGEWLGFDVIPGNVLIIDNELHGATSANRVPRVAAAMGVADEDYADGLFIENVRGHQWDFHALGRYLSQFRQREFNLIILDAFYRFMPPKTSENDNGAMTEIYNLLDSMAASLDCAIVAIHHASKGNQSQKAVTDVGAGAGAQSRAVDCHLVLRPHQEPGVVVLDAEVRSWGKVEPLCLRWDFPIWAIDDSLDPAELKTIKPNGRKQDDGQGQREAEQRILDVLLAQGPMTKTKLREAAKVSGSRIKDMLATLEFDARIEPCKVGQYDGFRLTQSRGPDNPDK